MPAWIVGGGHIRTPGSHVHYLSERVGRNTPFSPRLRQQSIRVIERSWGSEGVMMAELGTARLLNRLDASVHEIEDKSKWAFLL